MMPLLWRFFRFFLTVPILFWVSYEDYRNYKIPQKSYFILAGIGVIDAGIMGRSLTEIFMGFISISVVALLLYMATKGKFMGGGDIKLLAVSGILLGAVGNILAFILACFSVVLFYPLRKKVRKKCTKLAFAPYISLGIAISLLRGKEIIAAYMAWPGI